MNITDTPPAHVQAELEALSASLDEQVPPKMTDRNLLIATWNIKSFASVTKKWTAGDGDSPKRDFRAVHYITEIISRFDIIAIQEVKGDLRALRYMLKLLNRDAPNWSFLMTDVSQGNAGNNERMAFVFDTRRVSLSGLACELVVAPDDRVRPQPEQAQPDAEGDRVPGGAVQAAPVLREGRERIVPGAAGTRLRRDVHRAQGMGVRGIVDAGVGSGGLPQGLFGDAPLPGGPPGPAQRATAGQALVAPAGPQGLGAGGWRRLSGGSSEADEGPGGVSGPNEAARRILVEEPQQPAFEPVRHGEERVELRRGGLELLVDQLAGVLRLERARAGGEPPGHAAECIQVRPGPDLAEVARDLFGGHVLQGAHDEPAAQGEGRVVHGGGEPEVADA